MAAGAPVGIVVSGSVMGNETVAGSKPMRTPWPASVPLVAAEIGPGAAVVIHELSSYNETSQSSGCVNE